MIVARVRRTVVERGLIERGTRVLVGCSGGPDSAALLAALVDLAGELRLDLRAASVDHGLRPDAADDVALARAQADCLGVAFTPLKVAVPAGPSLQANARTARYLALRQLADRLGATRIAVGHTLDDQAETVLMRLLRGASVTGLCGVEPVRSDGVVRPLIDCRRSDVQAFARARFSRLAVDPSNEDVRYLRVRVRQGLLGALRLEDPAIDEHLSALADDARDVRDHLEQAAAALLERAARGDGTVSIQALEASPVALRRTALRTWVRDRCGREPGRSQLLELEGLLRGRGEVLLGAGLVARVEADGLKITGPPAEERSPDGGLDAGRAGAKVLGE